MHLTSRLPCSRESLTIAAGVKVSIGAVHKTLTDARLDTPRG